MNIFSGCNGNAGLWILIALVILGSNGNNCFNGIFSGCGLPLLLALVYCLTKNGTLSSLFGCCGCSDNCNNCGCGN